MSACLVDELVIVLILTGIILLLAGIFYNFGGISEAENMLNGRLCFQRVLLWGIPSALLVAGCVFLEKNNPLKINKIFIAIGDSSYSIYLTHTLIIPLLYLLWSNLRLGLSDIMIWVSMAIALCIGWLFYILVEKPLMKLLIVNCKL